MAKRKARKKISRKKIVKKEEDFSLVQFFLGVALCLFAACLLYKNITSLPFQLAIGIIGIFLIATSPFSLFKNIKQ